jgi:hypothetical protein
VGHVDLSLIAAVDSIIDSFCGVCRLLAAAVAANADENNYKDDATDDTSNNSSKSVRSTFYVGSG